MELLMSASSILGRRVDSRVLSGEFVGPNLRVLMPGLFGANGQPDERWLGSDLVRALSSVTQLCIPRVRHESQWRSSSGTDVQQVCSGQRRVHAGSKVAACYGAEAGGQGQPYLVERASDKRTFGVALVIRLVN